MQFQIVLCTVKNSTIHPRLKCICAHNFSMPWKASSKHKSSSSFVCILLWDISGNQQYVSHPSQFHIQLNGSWFPISYASPSCRFLTSNMMMSFLLIDVSSLTPMFNAIYKSSLHPFILCRFLIANARIHLNCQVRDLCIFV